MPPPPLPTQQLSCRSAPCGVELQTKTNACWCADGLDRHDGDYLQRLKAKEAESSGGAELHAPLRLLAYRLPERRRQQQSDQKMCDDGCELVGPEDGGATPVPCKVTVGARRRDALELQIICLRQSLSSGDFSPPPPPLCRGRHIKAGLSQDAPRQYTFPTPPLLFF